MHKYNVKLNKSAIMHTQLSEFHTTPPGSKYIWTGMEKRKENKDTDLYWKLTFRMKGLIKLYETKYSEMVVQEWNPIGIHVKKME